MAGTTGGISNSIYSSIYGSSNRNGISGLISGLDTDEIIKGMTIGTRNKISNNLKQKQKFTWQMDAMRSISSKMIDYSKKYTSYASNSNLLRASFYAKNLVSAVGDNSKYLSVSGSSQSADRLSIAAVEKLAQDMTAISKGTVSNGALDTGSFKFEGDVEMSKLSGQVLGITYGGTNHNIVFDQSLDYTTPEKAIESMNKSLESIPLSGGKTLADKVKFSLNSHNNVVLDYTNASDSNSLKINGGSESALKTLGFEGDESAENGTITGGENLTNDSIVEVVKFKDVLAGKKMSFNYNGVTKTIKMPEKGDPALDDVDKLGDYLQKELDKNFGSGRIKLELNKNTTTGETSMSFKTTLPDGTADPSSVLKLGSADYGLLGPNGVLKTNYGESNRLNLSGKLKDSGFTSAGMDYSLKINGVVIDKTIDGKKFDENTSISDIISAVNQSDAKVNISYLETSDKFSIVSTDPGASGKINIEMSDDGSGGLKDNIGSKIFGEVNDTNYSIADGEDAIIWVDYDGKGGQDPVRLTRSTNTFNIDGLNVTASKEFGMDASGKIDDTQAVTFDAKTDTDKVLEAIKDMVKDLNEIIELSNKEVATKPTRSYEPLTAEQKAEMSEDEIKAWEEKAKEGILFNNSDLRSFTSGLRFMFSANSDMVKRFSDIGISVSTSSEDNGKLTLDENKLKAAIAERPDEVQELMAGQVQYSVDETGKQKPIPNSGGVMVRMKDLFDQFAGTEGAVKGVFIQYAGSPSAPTSITKNTLYKRMEDIDKIVKNLQRTLKTQEDRYYRQFTNLEMMMSQANSQSSWLNQQLGGQ